MTILFDAGPIRNKNGAVIGAVVAFRDISDRKKAEKALQKARDELETKVRERTSELERRNREFNELAATTIEAMENDRKALAQEVHDSIGGTLAAIMFQLEERISHMDRHAMACDEMSFERILAHLKGAVRQTRRISKRLRPSILDDFGLEAAVKDTIADFSEFFPQLNISQEFDVYEKEIPDEVNIVLYRVTQEALNNIGKHSAANHVRIRLSEEGKQIHLQIDDDGIGFDTRTEIEKKDTIFGYGITSMKERVALCRGEFQIISEIGEGTSIRVSLPLNTAPHK
jgi:signal transduction histidine kinase